MATARTAAGTLLGTVTTIGSTASNIIGTVNDAVTIGNNFVARHLRMQQDKDTVELHYARVRLIEDNALEIAERREATGKRLKDETFKACYTAAHSELQALFAEAE